MSSLHKHNRPWLGRRVSFGINVAIWIIFFVFVYLIETGRFPSPKQGFFCDDRSISMRFKGETITTKMLLLTIPFVFPILWIFEACFYVPVSIKSSRIIYSALAAWNWYKMFFIGMSFHVFVLDGVKMFYSELRPHFLDSCKPDALRTCTPGQFVTDYKCTNIDASWLVRDSSKSFPSGHSSTIFFEAIFLIWYLQKRAPKFRSIMLIPFLQCTFLLMACFCAISRLNDHRHHYWDVIFGTAIGIIFAALTCIIICKNFQMKDTSGDELIHPNSNSIDHNHHVLLERNNDDLTRHVIAQ